MRICFLTTPEPDPLQDLLLIGLRELLGDRVVDHPKKEFLYDEQILPELPMKRDYVEIELMNSDFDLLIFGSVPRQKGQIRNMVEEQMFDAFHVQPVFLDSLPSGSVMKETYEFGPTFTASSSRLALVYLALPEFAEMYPTCASDRRATGIMAREFLEELSLITGKEFSIDEE